jgi:hypothetical protein
MRDEPAMTAGHAPRGGARTRGPELAAGAALAGAIVLLAALHFPDAGAIDALACVKFYLAQGCLP